MALSGACPGTVLAQVAVGIRSGLFALGGTAIAGIVWTGFLKPFVAKRKPPPALDETCSVHEALGVSYTVGVLGLEAMSAAVIAATLSSPSSGSGGPIHPVVGGLIIGGAQLVSLILRRSLVGVSVCYEEVGDWFWWSITGSEKGIPRTAAMLFATGLIGGAWAISVAVPATVDTEGISVSPLFALSGGFLMALGSRIAGGCTSGHGISGISLLSISSLVTIGTAFAVGISVAKCLY
jgi:hypothetical protein